MDRDDRPGKMRSPSADWPGGDPASPGAGTEIRALRKATAVVLVLLGLLICLIAYGMPTPTDPLDVEQPGFLIPWYLLPLIGTAAAVRLWPSGARRASAPLLIAIISLSSWCALFMLL